MSQAVPPAGKPARAAGSPSKPARASTRVTRYGGANRHRLWTFLYTTAWLVVLLALAIVIRLPGNPLSSLLPMSWEMAGATGAWFGMLGAVAISYKGVFDHWRSSEWVTGGWALWYVGRPFSGLVAGLMTYLLLQIVNPSQTPSTVALGVAAFIMGTQERLFFEFIQQVASLILTTPQSKPRTPSAPTATPAPASPAPTDMLLAPQSGIVSAAGAAAPAGAAPPAATHFADGGGKVLTQAELQLMFWGSSWDGGRTSGPSVQQISDAAKSILDSSYMSALAQYRGIQAGSLAAPVSITDSDPPAVFQDHDVADFIKQQIGKKRVPDPDANDQLLYCVIMPPGVRGADANVLGEHSYFLYFGYEPPFDVDVNLAHFAWVTNDGTLDGVTTILSHELVEACTDPQGSGFKATSGPCPESGWCEIGDVCYDTAVANGVTVQAYRSEKDSSCVIPGSGN